MPVQPPATTTPSGPTYDVTLAGPGASGEAAAVAPDVSTKQADGFGSVRMASVADDGSAQRSALLVAAGVILLAGLGLFLLRWTARRLGDG
jgi:hypothetical protein